MKRSLEPRVPQVVYFPDRALMVVLSAVLTWKFGWDKKGLEILGPAESSAHGLFTFKWPFQFSHMKHVRAAMSTSFVIALLGFFESSVAAKGLGEGPRDGVKGMSVSANRELVALGVANSVGGCFMALPAFGGYGRSKVNASTGAKSPMSNILLSIITLICILVLLPYLYYLPVGAALLCYTQSSCF
jgi:MFS superfamily sulfate permease-like transporter